MSPVTALVARHTLDSPVSVSLSEHYRGNPGDEKRLVMSDFSAHPEDVPAADWAEQQEDADPVRDEEEAELAAERPALGTAEVNEADLAEQQAEVFLDEED